MPSFNTDIDKGTSHGVVSFEPHRVRRSRCYFPALDVVLYGVEFEGMKLAGIVLIVVGFFLVMLPDNWPDYIMRLLRWSRRRQRGGGGSSRGRDATDYRTGYIRSHLRSPSGRVR